MRPVVFALLALMAMSPVSAQPVSPATSVTEDGPATASIAKSAHGRRTAKQRFHAANTTHDGKLTLDQAHAGKMTRVAKNFDAIDAGHKGYVTPEDIKAYNKAQRAARKLAQ